MNKRYDVICVGAGPGGYSAALRLAQSGKKTALIDYNKDNIGGVCLNEGCIPVKSMLKVSQLHKEVKKESDSYGLNLKAGSPDIEKINSYSKKVSDNLKSGLSYLFKKNNISFIEGKAKLLSEYKLEVTSVEKFVLEAENIILANGSRPIELPDFKVDGEQIISSKEALNLDRLPESIIIIGAGAVGVEFADIFNNLGSKVTLVEIKENILPGVEVEAAKSLEAILKKEGIKIHTAAKVSGIDKKSNLLKIKLVKPGNNDKEEEIEADMILLALGRCANLDESSLSKVGIKFKDKFIEVDKSMRTSIPNIYAVGDITGHPMLAHAAYRESEKAVSSINKEKRRPINYLEIPKIIYSNVELAYIGLTEEEAKSKGLDYKTAKYQFRSNSRAVLSNYADGFIKIIADKKTHRFIGVHMLGHEVSELIHQFAIALSNDITVDDMAEKAVYGHPTFSEAVCEACRGVFKKPLHS